ncbi:class I SAM-dependent RNA methyltransferase [Actinopolyspora erythraea]|uniref:RNA methyltransferase n=1 Tax=Actinopolyspora erythraea TaxID=414996 RepID=A0A099D4K2_9ACTN|nr:TRAM domain-containing protein [Actinopolyspora erythraea]ASU79499.1 class I SAM-dependent RNA methyltransferase [Actinopolyspora erythraea]KGI80871.1 RNA methyltransferase [Actinopolyspora erythraea]
MNEKPDWKGRRLRLEIGAVAHGGHCVARHEGRVVFVRHTLPGETVEALVTEDRGGGFCRADAVAVLEAAPGRVDPPCPLADMSRGTDRCGGCDWQHVDPAVQRELKAAVVGEQLSRLAGVEYPVEVLPLPGGPLRWRSRVRLAVDENGRAGFRAHRSHRVVPVRDCPITVEGALDGVTSRTWKPGSEVGVTRDGSGGVHVTEYSVRSRGSAGRGVRPSKRARKVRGTGTAHETAAGREWSVRSEGFWQVHPAAADRFAEVVARMADAPPGGRAWDLYGGVGLFAAVLGRQVGPSGEVVLVESGESAVRDAEANLSDLPQVRIRSGRVERLVTEPTVPAPHVVVLDPPRKGAGGDVVEAIVGARPRRVVHVACDPAALARDVGLFQGNGYRLTRLEAFDAFPMTQHVECIALLEDTERIS